MSYDGFISTQIQISLGLAKHVQNLSGCSRCDPKYEHYSTSITLVFQFRVVEVSHGSIYFSLNNDHLLGSMRNMEITDYEKVENPNWKMLPSKFYKLSCHNTEMEIAFRLQCR